MEVKITSCATPLNIGILIFIVNPRNAGVSDTAKGSFKYDKNMCLKVATLNNQHPVQ